MPEKCKLKEIIFQTNEGERKPFSIVKQLYKQQQQRQQRDLTNEFRNKGIFDTLPQMCGEVCFLVKCLLHFIYYILFFRLVWTQCFTAQMSAMESTQERQRCGFKKYPDIKVQNSLQILHPYFIYLTSYKNPYR